MKSAMPDIVRVPQTTSLSDAQLRALEMILGGATNRAVAAEIGYREETVARWKQLPAFASALEERRQELRERCGHRLEAGVAKALNTLHDAMESDQPWHIRLRAATSVLSAAVRVGHPGIRTDEDDDDVDAVAIELQLERLRAEARHHVTD